MKTLSQNPDTRYGGILEKESFFQRNTAWIKRNYFEILIVIGLTMANLLLIKKLDRFVYDQHNWPLFVTTGFLSVIYALRLSKRANKNISLIVLWVVVDLANNYYFVAISIGMLAGFILKELIYDLFLSWGTKKDPG